MLGPPLRGGWVLAQGHRILAVGDDAPPRGAADLVDLPDTAILPGLVNAHAHLEFSDLQQPLGPAGIKLHDWIAALIQLRGCPGRDVAEVIRRGAAEAVQGGARLIAEIATTPWAGMALDAGLEMVAFAEVLGLAAERAKRCLDAAGEHLDRLEMLAGVHGGISPHAPYSTSTATVQRCVELARQRRLPLAMHVAESPEERALVEQGGGPLADRLRDLGVFRPQCFGSGTGATGRLLEQLAAAPRVLVIHGHDLRREEIDFISAQPHMRLVYCPRTQHHFGTAPGGFDAMVARGHPVALGTDSRASNPDLSLWNEVRWLLRTRTDIPPETVLAMATIHGAEAFGRSDLGRIAAGAHSGLIGLPAEDAISSQRLVDHWIEHSQPRWLTSEYG